MACRFTETRHCYAKTVVNLREAMKFARSVRPHHAQTFARTVVPAVVRPAQVIWNQAIAAIFFILSIPAVLKAVQILREKQIDERNFFVLILSFIFAGVMIAFGVASLLKARRIGSRSR